MGYDNPLHGLDGDGNPLRIERESQNVPARAQGNPATPGPADAVHSQLAKDFQYGKALLTGSIFDVDVIHARRLLESIFGGNFDDEHRRKTPERFVKMLQQMNAPEPFEFTTFPAKSDEMIVLSPIKFHTLCAHHIAPFYGNVYIGYVPDKLIAGLSKFPRLVKNVCKGLWVQEELTSVLADHLEGHLEPLGVAVVMKAEHLCMAMRGAEEAGVKTTTSSMRGVFADHTRLARSEFFNLIRE